MAHFNMANSYFKRGRQAGQEDVCREILKFDPSFAHQIAREFLAQYEQNECDAGDTSQLANVGAN